MLWSREFIPCHLTGIPRENPQIKLSFLVAHLITHTTGVQSPPCNVALILHRGQKGTSLSLVSTSTSIFPCSSEGKDTWSLSRNEKQQRHSRSPRRWLYCSSTGFYHFLHRISVKAIQLHNPAVPYINPLPAQRREYRQREYSFLTADEMQLYKVESSATKVCLQEHNMKSRFAFYLLLKFINDYTKIFTNLMKVRCKTELLQTSSFKMVSHVCNLYLIMFKSVEH